MIFLPVLSCPFFSKDASNGGFGVGIVERPGLRAPSRGRAIFPDSQLLHESQGVFSRAGLKFAARRAGQSSFPPLAMINVQVYHFPFH